MQDSRRALVTGGSRGLGRSTALALADAGYAVTLSFKSDAVAAASVVAEIESKGGSARAINLDITDCDSVASLAESVSDGVDLLVNNAGEIPRPGNWDQLTGDALDLTISANLTGHIRVLQQVIPGMIDRGKGSIINIASTYAIIGAGAVMAYTASKAGLITVTYSLARELGPSGIRVNAIAPGNFKTAMADEAGPGFAEWVESTAPLGRLGEPSEIADAVLYLASAEYVTGHVLVVDGGHLLNT